MVGPKPKPVRPLTASKSGFEKPTENKTSKKKKSLKAEPAPDKNHKKKQDNKKDISESLNDSSKTEIKSDKTVYLQTGKIEEAVKALLKLLEVNSTEDKKDLFSEGEKVCLQVAGIKIPREREQQILKVRLPHCPLPATRDVCLIVKDLEKGIKVDHEDTVRHFTDLISEKGVVGVTQVISLRELKVEYKQFEAKRQLCNKFDLFLADSRIIRLLPQFLGKSFYKRKRIPLQIDLKAKDLKGEFSRCLTTTQLPMKHTGACSSVTVGHSEQEMVQLVDNIKAVVDSLVTKYPGTWQNIRSIHLQCGTTSLPLYVSLRSTKDLGLVTGNKRAFKPAVTGDLSTVVGGEVVVTAYGNVRVKRKADPNWTEADETLEKIADDVKPSNEEEDEEETEKKQQETPAKKKKQNVNDEKKSNKSKAEDSDDDIEDQELEYMKKVAEEEEEMERKLEADDQKLHEELKANEEEEDDDEKDVDDDAEAEDLLSDGDDSEEEEDEIMMRKSLKDIQEEIEEDPPAPKKKSKKAEAKKKSKKEKSKQNQVASKPVKSKEKKQQKFVEQKKKDKAKGKKK